MRREGAVRSTERGSLERGLLGGEQGGSEHLERLLGSSVFRLTQLNRESWAAFRACRVNS